MKIYNILCLLLILIIGISNIAATQTVPPIPTFKAFTPDWIISGDKVYINDNNCYLSATPHTITSSGWVEFELMSKQYDGNIDACLGFTEDCNVKKPQRWAQNVPHLIVENVPAEVVGIETIYNISSYDVLGLWDEVPYLGNYSNTHLIRLYHDDPQWHSPLIVAYTSYEQLDSTTAKFTFYYDGYVRQESYEYYPDWQSVELEFNKILTSVRGFDQWYYVQAATITANQTYKFRIWVDIPFRGLNTVSGKYAWGIKPSGESISYANDQGHLYLLDPWYSLSWDYRIKLTFDNTASSGDLDDFIPLVSVNSTTLDFDHCQNDGDDIRFTDSDGETLLDFYTVTWDNTTEVADFQVEVPTIDAGSSTDHIYMYYGNDGAANGENAGGFPSNLVLNSPLYADDASGSSWSSPDSYGHSHSLSGNPTHSSSGRYFDGNDGVSAGNNAALQVEDYMTLIMWVKPGDRGSSPNAHTFISKGTYGTSGDWTTWVDRGAGYWGLSSDGAQDYPIDAISMNESTWYNLVFRFNTTTCYYERDGGDEGNDTINAIPQNTTDNVRIGYEYGTRYYKGYVSHIMMFDETLGSDNTTQYYLAYKHKYGVGANDNFITFGSEEYKYDPPTVVTNSATNVENTTATLNGEVTDNGSDIITHYGFVWDLSDKGDPGDVDPSTPAGSWSNGWKSSKGDYGENPFSHNITSLLPGTTYHYRAAANNSAGWSYGNSTSFLTKPAAPTSVNATDGTSTSNVTIEWAKSTGATGYYVFRDSVQISGLLGDVAEYTDTGADAPTITAGNCSASDGTSELHTTISVTGESGNNGTTHTYKVRASNASGNSSDSDTDTGYRGIATLVYQAYRSAGDADHTFSVLAGATTDPYNDTTGAVDPSGYYYYYTINMTGAVSVNTSHDRGYRSAPSVLNPPTSFNATLAGSNIILEWVKGTGANTTVIIRNPDHYPTSLTDGTVSYNNTGISHIDVGYGDGTNIMYYSAWSSASGSYSSTYATASAGGDTMTSFIVLGAVGLFTILSVRRGSQLLVRLLGATSWIVWLAYFKSNPPLGLTEGSGTHNIIWLLLPLIGVLTCMLAGQSTKESRIYQNAGKGFGIEQEGYRMEFPDWVKGWFSDDESQNRTSRNKEQELADYKETLRRAYRAGEFNNRKRR